MASQTLTNNYHNSHVLDRIYTTSLSYPIVGTSNYDQYSNLYCFLSGIKPWDNESVPPDVVLSDKNLKQIHKDIFAIKQITPFDLSAVIERIDWVTGITYSRYKDTVDMFELDSNNKLVRKFYVRNSYDQVFKCIWNGEDISHTSGIASTIEPTILPGYTLTDLINTGDGYRWKYLYTIDPTQKFKFFDQSWMPISIQPYKLDISKSSVGFGTIDSVNVINSGNNYITDLTGGTTTTVAITGDGSGASAIAIVSGNIISSISILTSGTGYTYANCTISTASGYTGANAAAIVSISPISGTGVDLYSELGVKTTLVSCTFNSSESGNIPTNINYRQIGLISNPNLIAGGYANSSIYSCATLINVSSGGAYLSGERVFQGTLSAQTFSADVLTYDSARNFLYVINTINVPIQNLNIQGIGSGSVSQVLAVTSPLISKESGKLLYIENVSPIQRSDFSSEQFRLALKF